MKWNDRKDSFEKYANNLRFAALSLPVVTDEVILLNRLRARLPVKLQDQAALVSGSFDDVVSRVSCLSTAQITKTESIREVSESTSIAGASAGTCDNHSGRAVGLWGSKAPKIALLMINAITVNRWGISLDSGRTKRLKKRRRGK